MGALEAGRGALARAKPLLEAAIKEEPSIDALRVLAAITRQQKDVPTTLSLLERVPAVCLFVRPENVSALGLYDSIGMTRELTYRSLVF